ncbi:hypothetical protein I4U23_016521 [Adineta vaga]|nr:hypothetical protein I4U23_016521 [Adineta vaga]
MVSNECWNFRVGREFLESISWPSVLRKTIHDRCYCRRCYPSNLPDTLTVAHYTYVIPRGWTRFAVSVDEIFFNHHNVWKTWLNCYHGTSIESAKSCVEHRQLLLPTDVTMHGKKLEIRDGHISGEHYIFTTPSISYAGLDCYAHTYDFISPHNSRPYTIKVALQCKQKYDSIIVQSETVGAGESGTKICPYIPNDELEWKTQHRSSVMIYGLLLEIKRYNENLGIDPTPRPSPSSVIRDKVANILPIALLTVGQIYKFDCPIEPLIPQWMTVFGAVILGYFSLIFIMGSIIFKCCASYKGIVECIGGVLLEPLIIFFLAWLILGGVWILSAKSSVQHDLPNKPNYCQENLYKFALGFLLAVYALIVLIFLCGGITYLISKLRKSAQAPSTRQYRWHNYGGSGAMGNMMMVGIPLAASGLMMGLQSVPQGNFSGGFGNVFSQMGGFNGSGLQDVVPVGALGDIGAGFSDIGSGLGDIGSNLGDIGDIASNIFDIAGSLF